jgi:hypothetical protein
LADEKFDTATISEFTLALIPAFSSGEKENLGAPLEGSLIGDSIQRLALRRARI